MKQILYNFGAAYTFTLITAFGVSLGLVLGLALDFAGIGGGTAYVLIISTGWWVFSILGILSIRWRYGPLTTEAQAKTDQTAVAVERLHHSQP